MMTSITAPKKGDEAAKAGSDADGKKANQDAVAKVDQETVKPEPAPAAKAAPKYAHTVAKGRSVTSKKGILKEGSEIKAEWLGGGEESLKQLIDKKIVIKA